MFRGKGQGFILPPLPAWMGNSSSGPPCCGRREVGDSPSLPKTGLHWQAASLDAPLQSTGCWS